MRKIVAIAMVKNEMDIIESFARHTLGFADLLIVADHKSTDRTREILEALQEEELPVLIEDVAAARHAQAETMTRLLWLAADEHQADLIVLLDADEFLIPTDEASVRDVLETLAIDDVCSLRWQRYLPQSDDGIPAGVFALSVPLLRAKEPEQGQKIIVRGDVVRRDHPGIAEGNHMILREGRVAHGYHGDFCDGLELAHLYWRSPAQICSKFAVGWPNIAGKYGLSTPSGGGYQGVFERIRKGETPRRIEDDKAWEPCSLAGRVPFPTLRYSEDTVPDVLANALASSEALAAELAETRALASQPRVTTILLYLGGGQTSLANEAFHASLASALAEDYPWHEIIIPVFGGVIPRALVQDALERGVRLAAPESLLSDVKGQYVEWLLPGETVRPEKLRRMVTCFELQDLPYPLLLSDSYEQYPEGWPYRNFGVTEQENVRVIPCIEAWQDFLSSGTYPSRGLAGVLVRQSVFTACWSTMAASGFEGGRPHLLPLWRALLEAASRQTDTDWCLILHADYTGPVQEPSFEEIAVHQMDWHALCKRDHALFSEEKRAQIAATQKIIGDELLRQAGEEGADLSTSIWPAYRQMLAAL